jgi:hypothetical protein
MILKILPAKRHGQESLFLPDSAKTKKYYECEKCLEIDISSS